MTLGVVEIFEVWDGNFWVFASTSRHTEKKNRYFQKVTVKRIHKLTVSYFRIKKYMDYSRFPYDLKLFNHLRDETNNNIFIKRFFFFLYILNIWVYVTTFEIKIFYWIRKYYSLFYVLGMQLLKNKTHRRFLKKTFILE